MGEHYQVDLEALEKAATGVNGTLDQISIKKVSDIEHDEAGVGHEQLADTLSGFLDRWQRGVDNLAKDGQEIATRLTASVNAYRRVEEHTHKQFHGILHGAHDPAVKRR
ncbi:type VII secretion target [Streptomyces sp. NPDC048516]|uniref:type VII secretion target n=1 Tax=Streptomyces sp. NPDC048516 TaxID=3365565 RepID=UPI00371AB2A0